MLNNYSPTMRYPIYCIKCNQRFWTSNRKQAMCPECQKEEVEPRKWVQKYNRAMSRLGTSQG